MAVFRPAFDFMIINEGGFTDDKDDPGGRTNWGICQKYYHSGDVKEMTRDEAADWYLHNFWSSSVPFGDIHSQRVATKLFDMSVNMGIPFVRNGLFGRPFSRTEFDKLNLTSESDTLASLVTFCKHRYLTLLEASPKLVKFKNGWMARAERLPK